MDVAQKCVQLVLDLIVTGAQVTVCNHFALGVIGVGGNAQGDREFIGFQRIGDIGHGFRGLAQGNGQHACCLWVQGACMAGFVRAKGPFDFVHHGG